MVANIALLPHKDTLSKLSPFPTKLPWQVLDSRGQKMSKHHPVLEMDKCSRKHWSRDQEILQPKNAREPLRM